MQKIDYKDFVVDWCAATSIEEVVASTKLTRTQVRYYERRLRKAGVSLPERKSAGAGLDRLAVAQLNSLVTKHTK